VVKNPMDFGTMKTKVTAGLYEGTSDPAGSLFHDFVLVFDNCNLYNPEDGEVSQEAARVLGLLPEAYAASCATFAKRR
jgi:hypothetical protein